MTLNNLLYRYSKYEPGGVPLVVLVHGWDGSVHSYQTVERIAGMGFFCASVGMRGRNGADGARDVSAREIYDIYDAVQHIRANFGGYVNEKTVLVGFSGGGGNALAAACKFPDTWSMVVDIYGMSDYGRDPVNGWYQNCANGTYMTDIIAALGDSPGGAPNNYYARDATVAIQNYTGGFLQIFHDEADGVVPVIHSQRIVTALTTAGLSNYNANYTNAGSSVRWSHGLNTDGGAILEAEAVWMPRAKTQAAWTIPAAGTITVIGYIVTKRFTIWLNTGLDAAATVVYDTAAGTYTVTPLTSNAVVAVTITQGALTASGNTNGATLFTVA